MKIDTSKLSEQTKKDLADSFMYALSRKIQFKRTLIADTLAAVRDMMEDDARADDYQLDRKRDFATDLDAQLDELKKVEEVVAAEYVKLFGKSYVMPAGRTTPGAKSKTATKKDLDALLKKYSG